MTGERAYEEVVYLSADGRLELFARDYTSSGEVGEKPALLMMHGLTRNSADFEPLIDRLDPGCRVVVPDQRGRGLSQYDPDPANYRPDIYVNDMWRLLDRLGVERVICIGTSMGGLMAMVMGAQSSERIVGIVLNDIGPEVSAAGLDRIRSYVGGGEPMQDWAEAAVKCRSINESALLGLDHQDWLAFAHRTCAQAPDGLIRFAYDPLIAESVGEEDPATIPPDLWAAWEVLNSHPILVVRGAHSDILTAETLAKMQSRHSGSIDAVELQGRGHAPLLDEQPAVDAIGKFLAMLGLV